MTGDRQMVIRLYVTCTACDLTMKLDGDVEHDVGEFVCDQCSVRIRVQIAGSNRR